MKRKYYYVIITGVLIVAVTALTAMLIPQGLGPEETEGETSSYEETLDSTTAETTKPSPEEKKDEETSTEKAKRGTEKETAKKETKEAKEKKTDAESAEEASGETSEAAATASGEAAPAAAPETQPNYFEAPPAELTEAVPRSELTRGIPMYSYPGNRRPTGGNTLYLTFTLATEPGYTNRLMDIFAAKGVKATFFVTVNEYLHNRFIYDTAGIMRRMAGEGHTIGCHGYNHVYTSSLSDDAFIGELFQSKQRISEVVGSDYPMTYYTPPFEQLNQRDVNLVQQQGMDYVRQSFAYADLTGGLSAEQALACLSAGLADGTVYMLHATAANTAAMEAFIDYAKSQGYQFAALGNTGPAIQDPSADDSSSSAEESSSEEESSSSADESSSSSEEDSKDSSSGESDASESETGSSSEEESESVSSDEASKTESESPSDESSASETPSTESTAASESETPSSEETPSAPEETTTAAPETTTAAPEAATTASETASDVSE